MKRFYGVRCINSRDEVYAITVPKEIAILVSETKFSFERSGTSLLLQSGNDLLDMDKLNKLNLTNFRI